MKTYQYVLAMNKLSRWKFTIVNDHLNEKLYDSKMVKLLCSQIIYVLWVGLEL